VKGSRNAMKWFSLAAVLTLATCAFAKKCPTKLCPAGATCAEVGYDTPVLSPDQRFYWINLSQKNEIIGITVSPLTAKTYFVPQCAAIPATVLPGSQLPTPDAPSPNGEKDYLYLPCPTVGRCPLIQPKIKIGN
jgi:hypothetical protein